MLGNTESSSHSVLNGNSKTKETNTQKNMQNQTEVTDEKGTKKKKEEKTKRPGLVDEENQAALAK